MIPCEIVHGIFLPRGQKRENSEFCGDFMLLNCWLGHVTCKIVSKMTYNVLSGTLNPTIPMHGIP